MKRIKNVLFTDIVKECTGEEEIIFRYGIAQGVHYLEVLSLIITISIIVGTIKSVLLFLVFFFPLRVNAGGYHARSRRKCTMISSILILLMGSGVNYLLVNKISVLICIAFFALIIWFLSPVRSVSRELEDVEVLKYRRRTRVAILIELTILVIAVKARVALVTGVLFFVFLSVALLLFLGRVSIATNKGA